MITVEETVAILKVNRLQRSIEKLPLIETLGRVLAEDIFSTIDSPPYTNSAMDGFAARWLDVKTAINGNEKKLQIIGESKAGHPFNGELHENTAIRISTGAIVPESADCVIPIEKCRVNDHTVLVHSVQQQNQHIRFAGEEFKAGQHLLPAGIKIGSAQIALIASIGLKEIAVYRSPGVSIITTGSELVPFDQDIQSHQLRDSNTPMLITAILEAGGKIAKTLHATDDPWKTRQTIEQAFNKSQLIITSGGVSMGEHDHVRKVAIDMGFNELFWKVSQKPGKPMFLARKENTLLIALPGNPVSAYICFKHYVRPLIKDGCGFGFSWPKVKAKASVDIKNKIDRTLLLRVCFSETQNSAKIFGPLDRQDSHMSSTIAQADGYIIVGEGVEIKKGSWQDVFLFD